MSGDFTLEERDFILRVIVEQVNEVRRWRSGWSAGGWIDAIENMYRHISQSSIEGRRWQWIKGVTDIMFTWDLDTRGEFRILSLKMWSWKGATDQYDPIDRFVLVPVSEAQEEHLKRLLQAVCDAEKVVEADTRIGARVPISNAVFPRASAKAAEEVATGEDGHYAEPPHRLKHATQAKVPVTMREPIAPQAGLPEMMPVREARSERLLSTQELTEAPAGVETGPIERLQGRIVIAAQMKRGNKLRADGIRNLIESLRDVSTADDLGHLHDGAAQLADCLEWLADKGSEMQELSGDALGDRVRLMHRYLDYFCYSETVGAIVTLTSDQASVRLEQEIGEKLNDIVQDVQGKMKSFLRNGGIERIEPTPGSEFVSGLVEPSRRPAEPTTSSALHHTVCRVEPGEGGYRMGGRVLVPTLAIPYQYRPETRA